MSGRTATWAPLAPLPAELGADRRQLDLFVDGRDAIPVHEIVTGLVSRDVGRAETSLHRLRQEHPTTPT